MIVPYPVSPTTPSSFHAPDPTKRFAKLSNWIQKLSRLWASLHLSYRGGQYSIERLIALDEYCQKKPIAHVVYVCASVPVSLGLFIFALELMPAQDPTAGWSVNYGFWIRVAIVAMVIANVFLVQVKHFVQGCTISPRQLLLMVVLAAVFETALAVLVAVYTWFPIPFSIISMAPSFYPVLLSLFYVIVPREVIGEMLSQRDHVIRYLKFTAALQLMAVVYPAYQVLFHSVRDTQYELPVMLLLPVIKFTLKNAIMRTVAHMEDMMPEAVIFTVDFFNALYLSTSMETSTSTSAVVVVVLIDVIQSTIVLFRLNQRTRHLLKRLNEVAGQAPDILRGASQLCQDVDKFAKQNSYQIRIRSCLPTCLSMEARDTLEQLWKISYHGGLRRHTAPDRTDTGPRKSLLFESRQKLDKHLTWADRTTTEMFNNSMLSSIAGKSSKNPTHNPRILREALKVLFTTECLLLNATLDAFVPLFYGAFLVVLVHLPNAKYHTELAGTTSENVGDLVDTIFIFAAVELVSFGMLVVLVVGHGTLRRQFFYFP